jgi:hypothetical protein
MKTSRFRSRLSRRDFLKLLTAGGAAAAGVYMLSEYTPWMDYDGQSQRARLPGATDSNHTTQMHTLIHYATLAANGHNTQPWTFAIQEDADRDSSRYIPPFASRRPG